MLKISKMDAFSLVIDAVDKGDEKTANEILKIISKSISRESRFSNEIEVKGKKHEKIFKRLLEPQQEQEN